MPVVLVAVFGVGLALPLARRCPVPGRVPYGFCFPAWFGFWLRCVAPRCGWVRFLASAAVVSLLPRSLALRFSRSVSVGGWLAVCAYFVGCLPLAGVRVAVRWVPLLPPPFV
ncbi:hypothetical protein H6F43_03505 [Leptolyngbya sp. FACHB-36]|uniref:hypothetical protein n=1 Tax=Leptolyngbya sp. FACHB-36 TaxID=2692808 RepID=UPI001680B1BF|nr:hypothetical protein [Leptolyngbya sp. FACHB-36]MBD2019248.1 hypothetical protein [Leptolyngbya sp. FACHB-36]